ncbi:streptophobe family protein [Streptomyces sp. NBC_00986]|uniref:streptophobe family protein n=1 Tax=Streptomyces sp. NBC_00986 TaxID=2903702 RepID=UPI00386E01E2
MSSATSVRTANYDTRVPWIDVLLSAIAAVSWALIGMAGTAALGLHLLGADATGSLGPMTAAVVALGAGGSVTPTGDVSAFGLTGAQATTAVTITPLGVSLVGALLLSYFFLRSLRAAGVVISPAELLARAGSVIALFVAMLGGLAWAGHDVITIDGSKLGLDKLTGGGGSGGGVNIPGLGDIGDIGGLLPGKISDLVKAKAAVGFTVDTAPTLLGGLAWSAGILLIALLASRRTPLPRGWEPVHRVVRPAASALVTVLLVAVAAGLAAAAYAAIGDDHPKRIAGAALLGAPNGVWLGIPIGLFVPWDGRATGELAKLLPHPLDDLLSVKSDQPVTLGRLAELDGRVWLLGVAAALMMLLAGVLTAVRTPLGAGAGGGSASGGAGGRGSALGFAGRCAVRLGVVTALTLPLLAWLTDVSVDASLSVLGFDAFGAGIELHGHLGMALVLGAVWGAGAGGVGGLLAYATGAAGRQASRLARGDLGTPGPDPGSRTGTGSGSGSDAWAPGRPGYPEHAQAAGGAGQAGHPENAGDPGPYVPSSPYRAPNPATNPYLQLPDELRQPEDGRPSPPGRAWPGGKSPGQRGEARSRGAGSGGAGPGGSGPGGSGTGDAGPGGGVWSGGPGWPPDAGSPQGGGRPPGGGPQGSSAAQPPEGAGPGGRPRPRGPAWPPDAGSPTEVAWPPNARSPQEGGRPPGGGSRPGRAPQPPGNAGQFGADPGPGAVGAGGVGPYSGSSQPAGAVPPDDGTRPHDGPQPPGIPSPPADMYGAPTMAQSYEPPSRPPRRRPGSRSRDWPEGDSDGGQQPPPPPPAPPPPGKPKGRR